MLSSAINQDQKCGQEDQVHEHRADQRNRQQDAVQRATNAATGEIRSLRENIAQLRNDLDGAEFSKQEAVQSALATHQNEINHFKRMVNALRDEIDQKGHLHNERIQKAKQLKTMEFKELQETIIELRSELEKTHGR